MRTRWRILIAVALLLLGLYAALPLFGRVPALRNWIVTRVEGATGSQVRFESLRLNYDLSATLSGLSLTEAGRSPYLTAKRMDVSLRPSALFGGQPLGLRVEGPHVHVTELPTRSSTGGGAPTFPLHRAEIVDLFIHPLAGEESTVIGPLSLDLDSAQAAPGQLSLSGGGPLPESSGSMSWWAEIGPTFEASNGAISITAPSLVEAIRPWFDIVLPPAIRPTAALLQIGWRGMPSGRVALAVEARWELPVSERPIQLAGNGEIDPTGQLAWVALTGSGIGFRSDDEMRVANAVETRIEFSARRAEDKGLHADARVDVTAGEILWDRFYADLRQHPFTLRASLEPRGPIWNVTHGSLSITGLGTATGTGRYDVTSQQDRWRAEFTMPVLSSAFALALRDPFQEEYPVLRGTKLGGRASGEIDQERLPSGDRKVTGHLDLTGVTIDVSDPQVAVSGLDMHLPIDFNQAGAGSGAAKSGSLRLRGTRVADIAVGDVAFPLRVETNQIAVGEPVRIPFMGGALELAHLRAVRLADTPEATLGLGLYDLDLAQAARALGLPDLRGRMVGEIPSVTVDRRSARTEGEIRMDVFSGNIRLRNVFVEEPFSPVPTLRLDMDMSDLSLAELTSTLEIGHISGIIAGGARNLEIANGEPARFDAWMETVSTRGVPQRISVTAIRQLSILGGAGADPITLSVLGFFDEYRYAKMGFRCHLENDRFTLQGIEERDGAQYLVVGTTLPPRVNVISHTRVIAFSELVERLSRVMAVSEQPPPQGEAAEPPPTPTPE